MRALILKDIFVLMRQMKSFLLVLILFAIVFREGAGTFALFYTTMMLPFSTMAYDDQAKWPQLAVMLPYSIKDMVLSKYMVGWIFALFFSLISMLQVFDDPDYFWTVSLIFCIAMCFMAFVLPLVFWLGTEKGRLMLIALMAGIFGSISAVGYIVVNYNTYEFILSLSQGTALALALVVMVLLNALSIAVSIKLYRRRLMRG